MKKVLFFCFAMLASVCYGQYAYTGNFEDPGYNVTTYKQFGGGSRVAAASCNGAFGGQLAISLAFPSTGYMVDLSTIGQTGNGQNIAVSVNYKKGAAVTGTLRLAYFIFNSATNNWSIFPFGTAQTLTAAALTTCTPLTGTIPAGAIQPGQIAGVGVWFASSGNTVGNIFIDDIVLNQEVATAVPACTSLTYPTAGSTVSGGFINFQWTSVPQAVGYKLHVGTAPGASDVLNTTQSGTNFSATVPVGGTYYVRVIPYNTVGDAVGCTEISFNTNSQIGYCGPITSSSPTQTYPISSVAVNGGVPNTSSATAGAPAHEDFSATIFNVTAATNMTLNVTGTGLGTNIFGMTAFVDWNNNGSFNDTGEQYFISAPLATGTGTTINFSRTIAVPSGITGNRRMRIKYNFNGSNTVLNTALSDPCSNITNGQVEDYTLNVTTPSTAPSCATVTVPTAGGTVPANATFTWTAAAYASGYKIYLGTTAGGTNVLNGTLVSATSYSIMLNPATTYYLRIIPTNAIGDAMGCGEITFTTTNIQYCSALTFLNPEPISNVTFAGINNTTDAATAGAQSLEDFTAITGTVEQGMTYPISVNGNSDGNYTNFYIVFIDWNQNGILNDAGEVYFADGSLSLTNSTGVATPATGNIVVPAGALTGNTRMRIKKEYNTDAAAASASTLFKNPCAVGSNYGQAEDYTITVTASMGVSEITKDLFSVYPNPVSEILNIKSDEKILSVSIYDMSGRAMNVGAVNNQIDVRHLQSGTYLLEIKTSSGKQTKKFIKK